MLKTVTQSSLPHRTAMHNIFPFFLHYVTSLSPGSCTVPHPQTAFTPLPHIGCGLHHLHLTIPILLHPITTCHSHHLLPLPFPLHPQHANLHPTHPLNLQWNPTHLPQVTKETQNQPASWPPPDCAACPPSHGPP